MCTLYAQRRKVKKKTNGKKTTTNRMILHVYVCSPTEWRTRSSIWFTRDGEKRSHGGDGGSAKGENIGRRVAGRCGKEIHFEVTVKLNECWLRVVRADTESDFAFLLFSFTCFFFFGFLFGLLV